MPSFGRLSKHSNRSQHALPEQLSTAPGSGPGAGSGSAAAAAPPGGAAQTAGSGPGGAASGPGAAAQAESPAETNPQSALSSTTALSSSDLETFVDARPPPQGHPLQQQQQHLLQQHQQQQLHQQQQPPGPPPHLFNSQTAGVNTLPPLQTGGGAPTFEGHQVQTPIDFADAAVSRSQSQRYGAPLHQHQHQQQQQQQQVYPIASGSFDDLPSAGSYQQQHPPLQQQSIPAPAPQKRSTRKLIKGIFGSSRDSHEAAHQQQIQQQQLLLQQHHQQQLQQQQQQQQQQQPHQHATGPYDNTTGLARRPSKRVSNNSPNNKPISSQANRQPPDWDWDYQAQGGPQSQQPSPLREVGDEDEHSPYSAHNSNLDPPPQDSRILLNNNGAIRQLSTEHLEATSPYDDVDYHPPDHPPPHQQPHHQLQGQRQPTPPLEHPQPLQRQGTLRAPDQQIQYDSQQQLQQQQQQSQTPDYDPQSPQARSHSFRYPSKSPQPPGQFPPGEEPRLVTSQLGPNVQLQNPETVSQLSHDSPVTDSDPRSNIPQPLVQSSSAVNHAAAQSLDSSGNTPKPSQTQTANVQPQEQSAMAPPAPGGGPQSSRRGQDNDKALRGDPGYRGGSVSLSPMPPAPGQSAGQNPAYRGDRQFDASPGVEQGRNSPQPSDRDPELEKQFKDLLTKYKNVKRLYFDGKSQIETLNGQVEHLQNAVANQRMSQSRTAWDDNEYSTRFNRLNGAINNLAFNIRKDWRSLPPWLDSFVSADALKTGKQEMTAVGRAVVSRWLVEEVFNQCFHPALDTQLSAQLKEIELSIRGNAHTMHSQEEYDALTTKVVNWRMATLDGLQKKLNSTSAADNRGMLTEKVTTNLTAYLYQYLATPPPPGVEGSTSMIAELAVAIAANLPLESRDVAITYPLPGDVVLTHLMEVEKAGLPVLEGQKGDADADSDSDDEEPEDKDKNGKSRGKPGRLTKKRHDAPSRPSRGGSSLSSAQATVTDRESHPALPKDSGRVRFAGFVALEVRGRQVLMKAPVWTL